ncbi:MAG: hypothetical protein JXB19_10400 [Bacteroidales bacterium]|nr:hypothetical protein [Bacteroidales bacterium]
MKLLLIYCKSFGFKPTIKTVNNEPVKTTPAYYENIQAAFIQIEQKDTEREHEVEKKLLKNLKWICGKNQVNKVILHSFAHLSESKAEPDFTKQFFIRIEERMKNAGYEVKHTPFGYFLDLQLDAPGFSLARVFKDI